MCSIPPVPPPPPPPSLPHTNSITNLPNDIGYPNSIDTCQWASEYPELQKTCAKNNICVHNAPYKFKYNYFESISQVGPTCGLVALSMLVNGEVTPAEILDISKLEGFTSHGEMLSCKNMLTLARKVFYLTEINNGSCELKNGSLNSLETVEELLNGAVLLVPYDADANHSPCLKNGHTAHWALICGIIIVEDPGDLYETESRNIYVLCKHGKSKYLAMWGLADLDKSNKNLYEFSPKKGADGLTYVLPEGGIGGENGLRGQFIMVETL